MLKLTETVKTERTLSTPEEILNYVASEYERRQDKVPFKAGDKVRLVQRAGVPAEYLVGDVGVVMLCDPEHSPLSTLLGVSSVGQTIQFPVATEFLEKLA